LVATALSIDHKFNITEERERAEAADAVVMAVPQDAQFEREAVYEVSSS
jgi:hypothetical protein